MSNAIESEAQGQFQRRPGAAVRRLLVDSPASLGARARQRRWQIFMSIFPDFENMAVVDLGGTVDTWLRAPVRPKHVTVLNLFEPGDSSDQGIDTAVGDACQAREVLRSQGKPVSYDLAFSNSLIEHVGGHAQRQELASEVHALAEKHWVQTPNRVFPIEPHWLFPGMQFLPYSARVQIALRWPLTHTRPPDVQTAREEIMWTELLGRSQLRAYFPHSRIHDEKLGPWAKSLIAVAA